MRNLKERERIAIEAIAKRFSATWEKGGDRSGASIMVGGKRVAICIATLKLPGIGQGKDAKVRLRFDKVANRVIERVRVALRETVPDGMTVLLTITAPIRLPSKTAASLEEKAQSLLARCSLGRDEIATIHGNRIRMRLLRSKSERAPKMIGFVHNSDSSPLLLLNMTRELLEVISAEAGGPAPRPASDQWLIVISAGGSSCLAVYRHIYSQLRVATGFEKILMLFSDGRIGTLKE